VNETPAALQTFAKSKIVTARAAVALVANGDTIATGGFVGTGFPECIALASSATR
jgi:propionate CoA-transferase